MDRVSSVGGTRRIDKAFAAAAEVLKDSRPSVPKMVVLLTSGRQPLDAPSLAESAVPLHSLGAMFYVVSIANDLDQKYFEVLVEDSLMHVSKVPSFDSLNNALSQVTRGIEEGNLEPFTICLNYSLFQFQVPRLWRTGKIFILCLTNSL